MKNKYIVPLMELKKFDIENIVTQSAAALTNAEVVGTELKTKMQEKVQTVIDSNVFTYNTGW